MAHAGIIAPSVQSQGANADIPDLAAHELAVLIAGAEILDELPDLTIAVEEPGTRIGLAFGFGEQSGNEAFADTAFAAGD
jgi:hypothetical protein